MKAALVLPQVHGWHVSAAEQSFAVRDPSHRTRFVCGGLCHRNALYPCAHPRSRRSLPGTSGLVALAAVLVALVEASGTSPQTACGPRPWHGGNGGSPCVVQKRTERGSGGTLSADTRSLLWGRGGSCSGAPAAAVGCRQGVATWCVSNRACACDAGASLTGWRRGRQPLRRTE
jgi:hypothetical protein